MSNIPVYITKDARDLLWGYILSLPHSEIGGFGFAHVDNHNRLVWYDTFLVDQDVSASGVDFTDKGMAQAIDRAMQAGFLDDPKSVWVWWHSHGGLSTFWSSTDEGGVQALRQSGVPYMLSFVGNIKMESKTRLDVFSVPLIGHAEVDCTLKRFPDEDFQTQLDADIIEFVREKPDPKTSPPKTTGPNYTRTESKQRELPPGTRASDPGDRLDEAIDQATSAYKEYTQAELEGRTKELVEEALNGDEPAVMTEYANLGDAVDDEGGSFSWHDVCEWIPDEQSAKEWQDLGYRVVLFQNEFFLIEPEEGQLVDGQVVVNEKPEAEAVKA